MVKRHELTDAQWEAICDLLPEPKATGRRPEDGRKVFNGIFWILNTGAPWRDLPSRYGTWQTVYHRFTQYRKDGTIDRMLERLQMKLDEMGRIDWELFCVDGTSIRAAKAAAGAPAPKKKHQEAQEEPEDHALGRSRGGWGTKVHLVSDGQGVPLAVQVTAGQAHESTQFEKVLDAVRIRQPRGRPRKRPDAVAGDKGYSFGRIREWLKKRMIKDVIPTKSDQEARPSFDKQLYRRRNVVERCVGWLKECRRIATRYEKLAVNFIAMLKLSMLERYLSLAFSDTP